METRKDQLDAAKKLVGKSINGDGEVILNKRMLQNNYFIVAVFFSRQSQAPFGSHFVSYARVVCYHSLDHILQ